MKNFGIFLIFVAIIAFFGCKNKSINQLTISTVEKKIEIPVDSVKISGTLVLPDSVGVFPIVIIVPGSGPTDRNGNSSIGLSAQPYKMLADSLAKHGIASFRYDKRGIGQTRPLVSETLLRFDTYVSDLVAIINYLRNYSAFSKIIVLGHSEGALISAIAVQQANVDKFISVSGTSRPAYDILIEQLSNKKEINQKEVLRIVNELKNGRMTMSNDINLVSLFRPSVQPYLISWFKYNPTLVYAKISIPTLIIQGTTDIQIPINDAKNLANSNKQFKLVIVQGMNHILKDAPADTVKNQETYSNPKLPINSQFCIEVVGFITQ